jgi:hypothetical protein
VGLGGLEPPPSSLSGFCPWACFRRIAPATCANDLPLETAGDRCEPLGSDGMWTKRGPGTPRWRQRRTASRTLPGKVDLRQLPPTAGPRPATALLGGALAGSGPRTSSGYPDRREGIAPNPVLTP